MRGRRESWQQQAQCVQDYDDALRVTRQRAALKQLPDPVFLETLQRAQPYINRLRAGNGAPEPGRGTAAGAGVVGGTAALSQCR